ncbi:MAG: Pseudogene of virulence RhuM family protein [Methanobrevibacter sp. CfCl-M3]
MKFLKSNELNKNSVVKEILTTASDGKKYKTKFYNLDAILSVGYRINSKEATNFRIWANKILREYIIKGYVLDKELLKKGGRFTKDYFDKLLEDIKEIRASERRTYEKITDIYATSYDYNPKAELTKDFFANVQMNYTSL